MRVIGFKTYPIGKLQLPGNWPDILESDGAVTKVDSYREFGFLHEPIVRQSDRRLLVGHRRVAAASLAGAKRVRVKLVECDDAEAEIISDIENGLRDHDPESQGERVSRLVAHYEQVHARGVLPANKAVTPKSEARKTVAKLLGISNAAVRKAESRARQKTRPPIDLRGAEDLDEAWLSDVCEAHKLTMRGLKGARDALNALNQIGEYPSEGRIQAAMGEAQGLVRALGGLVPKTVCPVCRCSGEECPACEGFGFLTAFAAATMKLSDDE